MSKHARTTTPATLTRRELRAREREAEAARLGHQTAPPESPHPRPPAPRPTPPATEGSLLGGIAVIALALAAAAALAWAYLATPDATPMGVILQ